MTIDLEEPYSFQASTTWAGPVPSHWRMVAFKHVCSLIKDGTHLPPPRVSDGIPLLSVRNIQRGRFLFLEDDSQIAEAEYQKLCRPFSPMKDDVLMAIVGATLGKVALVPDMERFHIQRSLALFRANRALSLPTFIAGVLRSSGFQNLLWQHVGFSAQPGIYLGTVGNFPIPLPPLKEQTQIARFLDYETAKIDALIEKQQQLIALLKEKRQAVISHAVTKGLNPDAPIRDSGVEWLGGVPAHWRISKFGYISSVVRGGSPRPAGDPSLFNGNYMPWVTVAEITKDDDVQLCETAVSLTKQGSRQSRLFRSGTLILSNSGATLGVPKILMIDANANDGVVGFEHLKHNREFCYHYLSSLTTNLRERIKQGSGQPNLNTDIVRSLPVPIPPREEAELIVRYIGSLHQNFSVLSTKVEQAIHLLKEKRSALISAVVTGKIDVRGWTPPESSKAKAS